MKDIICIVCPNSCHLSIDSKTNKVIGQLCPRGEAFALQELTEPLRTLTTSVRTVFAHKPLVSVRTAGEVPKRLVPEIMRLLQPIVIDQPLPRGSVILDNVAGTSIAVITTSAITKGDSVHDR